MTSRTAHRAPGPEARPATVHVLLADGTTVLIRPTVPEDLRDLSALFAGLSAQSLRMRFFASGAAAGQEAAQRLCEPHPDRIALVAVAVRGEDEQIVGEGEAWRMGPGADAAEVGFTVAEGWRGRGIGTLLLEHLADAARAAGIRWFTAETLSENLAMKRVINSAGLHHSAQFEHGGTVFHDIDLTEDDAYLEVVADREFAACAASLRPLFRPRGVAVVGAGRSPGGVGRAILDHLVTAGFDRPLFAVNPRADEIAGVPCARSIDLLPQQVDLAVLAVPADALVEAAVACGRHGVRALTAVTSPVPEPVRTALKAVCRRYGMRLVGPNCLGVAAFGPDIAMDATFGAHTPLGGAAGVGVQSGGVGIAVLDHLSRLGIGAGSFASLGDKTDVSGNDLLAWWSQDPGTELVLLHLESFGNPRKFARYARRVARTKPVLTVAAGRSAAGSRAAASHTAAAVTPGITREALFRQAGVIATRSVAELVETAALLEAGVRPTGRRVAVVSNAGGTGVLAADSLVEAGLSVPEFGTGLRDRLSALLGPAAACGNPVDTGAGADGAMLRRAVEAVAASGEVDAVLLLLVPTALAELPPTLAADARTLGVPTVTVLVDQAASVTSAPAAGGRRVPVYGDAESAARALAHACAYTEWLRRPGSEVPSVPGVRSQDAARLISLHLASHPEGGWLPPDRAADLLACYGITCARMVLATDEHTAVTAAALWDSPVVLKAYWPELVHKSDVGGVLLGLSGPDAVREGWRTLEERFGDRLAGVVVQEMAPHGVELLAGVDSDAVFGPLVAFGIGGTDTDLAADRGYRLAPLTAADAEDLVGASRAATLLAGYRGRPGGDPAAVRDVLSRLALLAAEQTCVTEAEINPLIATPDGVTAVDFRVRVEPRTATDPYLRRLR
ncbi:GNAT family N-acetyltransferase [Catenulispora subtropica]|uniref:Bifunctional GNAT family N-acetyltransferase/acetate--CoA ligase family protein n=1 Tax=Catenulispora subtropica TaxID=450798 RepID=A0ABP5EV40_9ACTN